MCRLSIMFICKYHLLLLDDFQRKWPVRPGNLLNPCHLNDCSVLRFSCVSYKRRHSVCLSGMAVLLLRKSKVCEFGHPVRQCNLEPDQCLRRGMSSVLVSHSKFSVSVASLLILCSVLCF